MTGPLDRGKEVMAKRMMAQMTPSETPIGQAIADAIVAVENQQASVVEDLREAVDLDVEHGHDPQRRREALLGLADAVADDEFRSWYFAEVLGEILDNSEQAAKYAGLEADEWEEQKRDWYRQYAEADLVDESLEDADQDDIDEVADRHLSEMYGADLEEFRGGVVEWSQAEAVQQVLAGPVLRHNQIIAGAVEEIEGLQERVDELEEQLDGDG